MNNIDFGTLLFSFKGRITRGPFWAVQGCWAVIYIIFLVITQASAGDSGSPNMILAIILFLFVVASIWPLLAVQIKRWHDRNKSGWWCLIGLVPVIGGLWALIE